MSFQLSLSPRPLFPLHNAFSAIKAHVSFSHLGSILRSAIKAHVSFRHSGSILRSSILAHVLFRFNFAFSQSGSCFLQPFRLNFAFSHSGSCFVQPSRLFSLQPLGLNCGLAGNDHVSSSHSGSFFFTPCQLCHSASNRFVGVCKRTNVMARRRRRWHCRNLSSVSI